MDTKLKSKIGMIAWLILFTYGISGVLSLIFDNDDYLKSSYYKTNQFENHVKQLLTYIYSFEINYQPQEELIESLSVTKEEIEQYRSHYGVYEERFRTIKHQYDSRIREVEKEGNQEAVAELKAQRDEEIKEITSIFKDDEYVTNEILKEKEQRIETYYGELEDYRTEYQKYKSTFDYYLKNTETGIVYTNLSSSDRKALNEDNMDFLRSYPSDNQTYLRLNPRHLVWDYDVDLFPTQDPKALYEGQIGISKNIPDSNFIMREFHDFKSKQYLFWLYTAGAVIALIISVMIEKRKKLLRRFIPEKGKNLYNKIPIDIAVIVFVISLMISLAFTFEKSYLYYYSNGITWTLEVIIYHLVWLAIIYGLTFILGAYLYRRLKGLSTFWEDWEHSFTVSCLNTIRNAFLNRRVGTQAFFIMLFIFFIGLSLGLTGSDEDFLALFIPAFLIGIPMFIIIIRRIGYFNQILKYAGALANGEFEPDLKVKGKSFLAKLAGDLNKMKSGVKTSQHAQAKSERLKTELITNVSHDLRTPLTSIITYTELLKNPNLPEDERSSYVEIIDRKSKRLKVLIDDLFEASKMASGAIELVKERVDINELLHQALAEYDETIEHSTIQFRLNTPEQPVYSMVDGQKLWRVFENLIGNILKYSQDHTRAYIDVKEDHAHVAITFKNISKYELSDNIDELFERFKRGDESRHTDGSGLGLAIAKSIIDLHDGTLDIVFDGDLFKVTIKLNVTNQKMK